MKKYKTIETKLAPNAIGPYSQGIITGDLLFVSGQIGLNPETGELISNRFEEQARQSIENLKNIILEGGVDLSHVVSVDVFLTDLKNFKLFNQIYQNFFTENKPARAVVEVSALPKNALIEIKCIACLKSS